MNSSCLKHTVVLLTIIGSQSYAQQYNKRQIDSVTEVARFSNNFEQGMKLGTVVYNASKAINYQRGVVNALFIYALKNSNCRRDEQAFKYAVEAENEAAKLPEPSDFIAHAALIKGISYYDLGFRDDAIKTLLKGIAISQEIENADKRHKRLGDIYNALALFSGNSKAIGLFKKSYSEYIKVRRPVKSIGELQQVEDNLADAFLKIKQLDSAEFYLNKAIPLAAEEKDTMTMAFIYTNFGELYFTRNQYAIAERYYKKGIVMTQKFNDARLLKDIYLPLSKVCAALNEKEEALKYLELNAKLVDSLNNIEKSSIKTPLNYIVQYKENQLAAIRNKYLHIILQICFILIVVACASIYLYNRFRKKLKLTTEKINELVANINLNEDKRSPAKIEELKIVVQLAVNNAPAFITKFNQYDTEFSKKLLKLAPGLVLSEIEFCALLRLNFETKEIARYSRISVRAVEGKKYRIRKKLGVPSDQDINVWMSHI